MNKRLLFTSVAALAVSVASAADMKGTDSRLTAASAMAFLEYVTGALPADAEKDWWDVGRYQHGPDAKRYHIAFSGYAAAALAQADSSLRERAGKVLAACIGRMLRRDVWGYTQSPKRWGNAAWAPDPCYRENVMYTGHLLQLLACYERLTGDTRYWTSGFDFVWTKERTVHYTVQKLIDVTVAQMRANDCGGVSCEPDLVFFPCNNHPQIALRLFAKLGHGDWSADTRKWETWALAHYPDPIFGGGAVKYCHHLKTGLMYPRGTAGLDGWSLLWYEPWATDRTTALGLWKKVAAKIDWKTFDAPEGACASGGGCCDPAPVPTAVAAVFLAAAARACDDPQTAARLETAVDGRFLTFEKGLPVLDVDRNWRIGATAVRLLAFAEEKGAKLRNM